MATEHLLKAIDTAAAFAAKNELQPFEYWIARRVALAVVRELESNDAFRQVELPLPVVSPWH